MSGINRRLVRLAVASNGRRMPLRNYRHLPVALLQSINRRFFGQYPPLPFIPFEAISAITRHLTPHAEIVEVGAGQSTIYYAKRCRFITAYEWNPEWFERLGTIISDSGLTNIELLFGRDPDQNLFDAHKDASVDLLIVDGGKRSKALVEGWQKVKPGGLIYLDNTESEIFWTEDGINAWHFLDQVRGDIESETDFVDYAPASVGVTMGKLIRKRV